MKLTERNLRNLIKKELKESTGLYQFSGSPPRAGHLPAGTERDLGGRAGLPEPWYEKLGYKQLDHPEADDMFQDLDPKSPIVRQQTSVTSTDQESSAINVQKRRADDETVDKERESEGSEGEEIEQNAEEKLREIVRYEIKNILT